MICFSEIFVIDYHFCWVICNFRLSIIAQPKPSPVLPCPALPYFYIWAPRVCTIMFPLSLYSFSIILPYSYQVSHLLRQVDCTIQAQSSPAQPPSQGYQDILGIFWTYHEHILDLSRTYIGHIIEISWAYFWLIFGIDLANFEHALNIFWTYLLYILVISWPYMQHIWDIS